MISYQLSKRERTLLLIAGGLLLITILWIWVIEPFFSTWLELNGQIETTELLAEKYQRIINRQDQIYSSYRQFTRVAGFTASPEEESALLLRYVEKSAGNTAAILNIRPLPVAYSDRFEKYRIEVEFEAEFKSLVGFIYLLEQTKEPIRIERIRFYPQRQDAGLLRGKMTVTKMVLAAQNISLLEKTE